MTMNGFLGEKVKRESYRCSEPTTRASAQMQRLLLSSFRVKDDDRVLFVDSRFHLGSFIIDIMENSVTKPNMVGRKLGMLFLLVVY
jgi:hypothetical protein